ncbi:hypothetical protein GCM10009555_097960 [Acrocarpospora macrocephala]|uniref:Uncharacterized protein n=1 Tax=Acrocarpospora macrocephala TaxID=150177 RepID=A0A5M3WWL6_9ACTN|nr:hypothetical protein Amac_062190 [Acrocarpospora macrocephala]
MSLAGLGWPVFATLLTIAVICQRASLGFFVSAEDENTTGCGMIAAIKERLVRWFRTAALVGANLLSGLAVEAAVSG